MSWSDFVGATLALAFTGATLVLAERLGSIAAAHLLGLMAGAVAAGLGTAVREHKRSLQARADRGTWGSWR